MRDSEARVRVGRGVYVAHTAYVGGDVILGDQCTVMHQVSIRADVAPICIGRRVNVQDGAVLHTQSGVALEIADDVIIGHRAVVHCRRVASRTLIGIGSIVLDGAHVGTGCIVAAGAVVTPGTRIRDGFLVAGVPAREVREVTAAELDYIDHVVERYVQLGRRHAEGEFSNIFDE